MIDLSLFNLNSLQALHLSYEHIINVHQKALDENEKCEVPNRTVKIALFEKIKIFNEQLNMIKDKIDSLSKENLRFSVESLFFYFGFLKKNIQIFFLTTSDAYKKYGAYLTGFLIYHEEDIPILLKQFKDGVNTDGVVYFNDQVSILSQELRTDLKTKGFLVSEISHIY